MAKTAEKTAAFVENIEFPSFDASKATDQIRAFAEKGVEQAKDFQAAAGKAAEKVSAPMKTVFEKAVKELKVA